MSENRHEPQCKKTTKDEIKSNFSLVLYIYATSSNSGSGISTGNMLLLITL